MLCTWCRNRLEVMIRLEFRGSSKNIKSELTLATKARGMTKMLQYRAGQERLTRLAPVTFQTKAETQYTWSLLISSRMYQRQICTTMTCSMCPRYGHITLESKTVSQTKEICLCGMRPSRNVPHLKLFPACNGYSKSLILEQGKFPLSYFLKLTQILSIVC